MESETKIFTYYCQTIIPDLLKLSVFIFSYDKMLYWPNKPSDSCLLYLRVTFHTSEISKINLKKKEMYKNYWKNLLYLSNRKSTLQQLQLCSVVLIQILSEILVFIFFILLQDK